MDDKTNQILEAILLAIQDQHKSIIKLDTRLENLENRMIAVEKAIVDLQNIVRENTREISKLTVAVERHDREIEKVIEVHGEDIMVLKDKVAKLEKKSK